MMMHSFHCLLLTNMQSLSEQWRESVGGHGELVFYVDNC